MTDAEKAELGRLAEIERLETRRNALDHEYGYGSFRDGLVRDKIAEIDARLKVLRSPQEPTTQAPGKPGDLGGDYV